LFKTYWRRKHEYPLSFALPENTDLKVFRFKDPQATEKWLSDLAIVPEA